MSLNDDGGGVGEDLRMVGALQSSMLQRSVGLDEKQQNGHGSHGWQAPQQQKGGKMSRVYDWALKNYQRLLES